MGGYQNPALNPVDTLPQPKDPGIQFTPPPQEVGANMPGNQRGWAGPGGQAAGMAADVLHGWMVGKWMGEQRQMKNAVSQVGNAKAALDMTIASAANLRNSGLADDDPKMQQAKAGVSGAYQAWLKNVGQYVAPPEAQGVGGKLKAGLKKAFLPQGPELIQQAALTGLQQADPWNLVPQRSTQQQAADTTAKATATTAQVTAGEATGKAKAQADLTAANNEYAAAKQSNDPQRIAAAQANAETALANLQTQTGTPSIPAYGAAAVQQQHVAVAGKEMANKEQILQAQNEGMTALNAGAMPSQLSAGQQYAMNGGKLFDNFQDEMWKGFQQQVKTPANPNGKYNTAQEAAKDFMIEQRRAAQYSRYAPIGVQIQQDTQDRLQTELQNPQAVEQYKKKYPNLAQSITQIRPGDMPPSALVSAEAESRLRSTPEERAAAQQSAQEGNLLKTIGATGINRMRGEIVDDAVRGNPDWKRFRQDAGSVTTGLYSAPLPASAVKSGFFERDATAQAEYKKFQSALIDGARTRGLTPAEINQVWPGSVPMDSPPGPAQKDLGNGPPGPAATPRSYKMTAPDGQSKLSPAWTPQQLDNAQKAYPQYKFEPSGPGGQ